jgi:hypothetical protein
LKYSHHGRRNAPDSVELSVDGHLESIEDGGQRLSPQEALQQAFRQGDVSAPPSPLL